MKIILFFLVCESVSWSILQLKTKNQYNDVFEFEPRFIVCSEKNDHSNLEFCEKIPPQKKTLLKIDVKLLLAGSKCY